MKLKDDDRVSSVLLEIADGVHYVVKNWRLINWNYT